MANQRVDTDARMDECGYGLFVTQGLAPTNTVTCAGRGAVFIMRAPRDWPSFGQEAILTESLLVSVPHLLVR